VESLIRLLGRANGREFTAPQCATLFAHGVWLVVAVLLVYLGIAMFVALFSKDDKRAERARAIFADLVCLFRWRRPR
jgi:hypothetical protein